MECVKSLEHAPDCHLCCHGPFHQPEKHFWVSVAPVLAGIQPAALISFRHTARTLFMDRLAFLCENTGLRAFPLAQRASTVLVLVYHDLRLGAALADPSAQGILVGYGYPPSPCIKAYLQHLASRLDGGGFPHEIGVFLGYPPKDVAAFIQHGGRNYLCCRYWKVYHDECAARRIFAAIDHAKARALHLISQQLPVRTAAQLLTLMS